MPKTLAASFQENQGLSHHQKLILLWKPHKPRWRINISKMFTSPPLTKIQQKIILFEAFQPAKPIMTSCLLLLLNISFYERHPHIYSHPHTSLGFLSLSPDSALPKPSTRPAGTALCLKAPCCILNLFPTPFQSQVKLASFLSPSSSRLKAADSFTLTYLRVTSHISKNIILTTACENPDYNIFCTSWSLSFTKLQMTLFLFSKDLASAQNFPLHFLSR